MLKLMLKRGAATYGTDAGAVLFKKLKGPQADAIAGKLSALGFTKGEDLHDFQHKLASLATGLGDDTQSSFVMDVLTQSMIQFNPTFAAAYTGYKLAQEGYKEMARWVGNTTTRAMFDDLQRYDPDASNPNNRDVALILQQRDFDAAELAEPRRILTNHNRAEHKPPPTDREVKIFILQQYNAWDEEKQRRAAEAPLLQRAKAYYDTLKQFEKEKMFEEDDEDLDEPAVAARFMDEYMKIYRSLMAMKGDKPWPAQGKAYVEGLAFDLLKRKLDDYADDAGKYEDWFYDQMQIIGWAKRPDQKQIDNAARYLSSLMLTAPEKIESMAHQMGMEMPDSARQCLCPGGQSYAGGLCHFIGPLGGAFAVPVDPTKARDCLASAPAGDKSFAQRVVEWPDRRDRRLASSN